ncbi:TVP38/TMEM64 family protein [Corynebacterium tapiri]|uniref:TVP38/TMEM64 family membrane protein n=2 Tax=Corynebacterium tapiri TaxID=1448266 RepID=A0A5C4U4Q7_9CORY|nr:TVP38/TMEM64 family protein [Corynebacterium tapiri]
MLVDVPGLATMRTWAEQLGPAFVVVFWLFYVLITQFPIPRTVLTISAGALFGPWLGIALSLSATTVAAVISLVVVRNLLKEWIAPRLTHPMIERINARLRQRGWLAITSLRLIAGVPFSIMNYAAAVSDVRVGVFAVATLVGSAPGTILVTLFGDALATRSNPWALAAMAVLAVIGIVGVLVDAKTPTQSESVKAER